MPLREVELHPIAVGERQRRNGRYLADLDAGGAREGLADDQGLFLDLARIGKMLEVAAAALAVDRAGRLDPVPARLEQLDDRGLGVVPTCLAVIEASKVSPGKGKGHEDGLPFEEGEPVAPGDELLYAQLDRVRIRHPVR